MNEDLKYLADEANLEALFDSLPFSLRQDRIADIMAEPAGPIKAGTGVVGHCPSGPVREDGRRDRS